MYNIHDLLSTVYTVDNNMGVDVVTVRMQCVWWAACMMSRISEQNPLLQIILLVGVAEAY